MITTWLLAGLCLFGFALFSARLERSVVTAPMAFTALGGLASATGLIGAEHESVVHTLAEITLILVLFTDAARMDLSRLRAEHDIPVRLLTVGLPLSILVGAGLARVVLPDLSWAQAGVLAAVLAPTDAALGQAVVSNPRVPVRIRQALNVESGLNDGIALPVVLILISLASGAAGGDADAWTWVRFTALQVVLGPLVGVAVGYVGGRGVEAATRSGTMTHGFRDLSVIALAFVAFAAAESVGGNGFIAAFVGGLTLGNIARDHCECLYDFSESEGQLLTVATFAMFGAITVPAALEHIDVRVLVYVGASLTVVRLLPVFVAVSGKHLGTPTKLFLGWFGPRGLATILFGLLVVEGAEIPGAERIVATAVCAVIASTLLHGVTAYPLSIAYARWAESTTAEQRPVSSMPTRVSMAAHPPSPAPSD